MSQYNELDEIVAQLQKDNTELLESLRGLDEVIDEQKDTIDKLQAVLGQNTFNILKADAIRKMVEELNIDHDYKLILSYANNLEKK